MGAPPSDDDMARMLEDPNVAQQLNEALNNPQIVDMMINSIPGMANNPQAREMFRSPEFRRMMTNPEALRQANQMRRMMGGGAGAGGFPAPGVTESSAAGAAGSNPNQPVNPFAQGAFGGGLAGAGNPFGSLFGNLGMQGQTPVQTPPAAGSTGQGTPSATSPSASAAQNPFASLFGGGMPQLPAGMPPPTPEQIQQAMQMFGPGGLFGGGGNNPFGGASASPPPPADTRPPEEIYAEQLRQLNDMGFFDFDQNVAALRRSGGSVQGAIEQLLR